MPFEQVLMQIKDNPSLKWLEKMKGDPNKRNRNKYYRFHRDHGYDTNECFNLKQQIENLIKQGKLRNFLGRDHKDEKLKGKLEESSWPPLGEIRVIIAGILIGQFFQVKEDVPEGSAKHPTFRTIPKDKGNGRASHYVHPHDDAIVITLLFADYTTKKVLVDNGSLADILYYLAFEQMRLGRD